MFTWFILVLIAGVGILILNHYIFETFLVNENGRYNSAYAGYLSIVCWALFFIAVISPLYMEFQGWASQWDKYVVYEEDVKDLDVATFTAFRNIETFSIDTWGQRTPINKLSEVAVKDGESRLLVYDLEVKPVQDPEIYWQLKQQGNIPHIDGRSKKWRMAAYSFHHNREEKIEQIAKLGDRDGEQACKQLSRFIENEFPHSKALEVSLSECYLN